MYHSSKLAVDVLRGGVSVKCYLFVSALRPVSLSSFLPQLIYKISLLFNQSKNSRKEVQSFVLRCCMEARTRMQHIQQHLDTETGDSVGS